MYKYEDVGVDKMAVTEKKKVNPNQEVYWHTVTKGDTLYSISKKYNIPVDELKKQNNISENTISIGQNLKVE